MGKSKATRPTPEQLQKQLDGTNAKLIEAEQTAQRAEQARLTTIETTHRLSHEKGAAEKRCEGLAEELLQSRNHAGDLDVECVNLRQEKQADSARIAALDKTIAELRKSLASAQAIAGTFREERDSARKLRWLWIALALGVIAVAAASTAHGQATASYAWDDPHLSLHVPQHVLQMFRNPDGSCVQCSNAMTGTDQNVGAFAYLLWDSEYGPKVRGGSSPSRVERYAKERNVRIYNVTGRSTWDWMRWACANGRGVAIGAGGNHFQTLVGYDPPTKRWFVVNNNGDQHIAEYSDEAFRRLHLASGQWCVVLDYPPAPAPPKYLAWWTDDAFPNPPPQEFAGQ